MITWFTSNLLWTQGVTIALCLSILTLSAWFVSRKVASVFLLLFAFSFYFFRNPERVCPELAYDPAVLVCPADGKVVDVQYDASAPFDGYAHKISIFLSPLDVHVNWIPTPGVVEKVMYRPGTFTFAFLPKSSEFNERNDILVRHASGNTLIVRQIAGIIARRICCWVQEGQTVEAGEKYGMIRFGSRIDLLLPAMVDVAVAVGQKVVGGQTVVARWRS